jgi:protein-tyrosine-phosphatase
MGCGDRCPQVKSRKRSEWEIPDPRAMPPDEFRVLRDLIEGRVKELLANLLQPPGSGRQG